MLNSSYFSIKFMGFTCISNFLSSKPKRRATVLLSGDTSKWYTVRDRYLLESMLVYALRHDFIQASYKIARVMREGGIQLSSISLWCLNALSKRLCDLTKKSGDPELLVILEELSNAAEALSIAAGPESPYTEPLHAYKCHADKILMFLSLESYSEAQLANIICKLNQKFSPHSMDTEIQSFRSQFANILSSLDDNRHFVLQTWLPNRDSAFKVLFNDVQRVVQHLPSTFLDQVGTRHHRAFVQAVNKTNTDLGRILLTEFKAENTEITESKLIQVMNAMELH